VARKTWFPALRARAGTAPSGRGSLDSRVVTGPRGYIVPGQPYATDWNTDRAVREGYQWNPWVFRCVEFVASNERARRIVLRDEDPDEGQIIEASKQDRDQRQLLRRLNRKANEWEIAQIFRHRLVGQYMLSARGVFVEAVRSRRGGIHSLYLLDPDAVEPVPGRRKRNADDPNEIGVVTPIESFRVTTAVANGAPRWDWRPPFDPNATAETQPSGIVWLRSPHPTIFERGMSPMEAAGLSTDLDRYARLYNRRFMMEDGRPGGVLSVKGPLDEVYEEKLQDRFRGGPGVSNARTVVIEAEDMSWADTSGHPRDMQWSETMDRTKREICVAFGLPESVVSDAGGQTFDNADADYAKAWEHCMLPIFRLLDGQLDVLTPGGFDDETYLAHDVSDVWVLGRHKRAKEDRATQDFLNGIRNLDETRDIYGLDPYDVPGTRVLWIPAAKLAVGDGKPAHDGDQEAAGALPIGNGIDPTAAPPGAGIPGALPPSFGLDPTADLMGGGGEPGDGGDGASAEGVGAPPAQPAVGGPPQQRAIAQAGRTVPGGGVTAAPGGVAVKSREGEQGRAHPVAVGGR
jgi:phage portal protein BeeE